MLNNWQRDKDKRYPLRDNASLLHFRIDLGYGSISFPIEPCHFSAILFYS